MSEIERPLRLVQAAALPFPSSQGSQVYVGGMVAALARRGHEVTLVCYGHGAPGGVQAAGAGYSIVRTPRLPGYHRLASGPDPIKPWLDAALALRLATQRADLVHAHHYEACLAALLARPLNRCPVVYSAHTTLGEELPSYFTGRWAPRLAALCGRSLDRSVPRRADHVVALRPATIGPLLDLGCREVTAIAPGVDPGELGPGPSAELPPGPWIVYAGNTDRYQDLDVLRAAMRRVRGAGLLLVSAGSLESWRHCGLPRFRAVQTSDFEEVKSLLRASAMGVLPRAVCPGYPVKLLNYLGLGLPSVVACEGMEPMPGLIRAPAGDPVGLAAQLQDLVDRPRLRRDLGIRARSHVLTSCTWDQRARDLEVVYARVLGARSRRCGNHR